MAITASLPKQTFAAIALDNTQALYPLLVYASMVGLKVNASGSTAKLSGIVDLDMFTLTTALGIVQAGGEVTGFPCWIKIAEDDYEDTVPLYLPNRTQGEEGEEVRKWSEYTDGNHDHLLKDGFYYIPTNAFGEDLPGSILAQLYAGGFALIETADYVALVSE